LHRAIAGPALGTCSLVLDLDQRNDQRQECRSGKHEHKPHPRCAEGSTNAARE
jgi:hypothetical protein